VREAVGVMRAAVPAEVPAVAVAADVRREERAVQGRVESAAQGGGAALHMDGGQPLLPRVAGLLPYRVEGPAALGAQVGRGAARVDVRQGGGRLDGTVPGRVEADVGAAVSAPGPRGEGGAVPGAVRGEGPAEAGDRVHGVRAGVPAEAVA